MNCERVIANIRNELKNYLIRYPGLKSLVIGVSGGIDSALCCALARPVCDEMNVKLIGRSIPIVTNKDDEIERAELVGKSFCHDFREIDLCNTFFNLRSDIIEFNEIDTFEKAEDETKAKIRMGNLKARIRMIFLYDLAQKEKGIVLSTDNFCEMLLDFWTLNGDVGDFSMIQLLWKTEVYELSKYISINLTANENSKKGIALAKCIEAKPTDGLGVSDSDLDQFGAKSYEEVELLLKKYLSDTCDIDNPFDNKIKLTDDEWSKIQSHSVIQRFKKSYKRNLPVFVKRENIIK